MYLKMIDEIKFPLEDAINFHFILVYKSVYVYFITCIIFVSLFLLMKYMRLSTYKEKRFI